jgi:Fic family protein
MWRLNWIHPFPDGNGRTSRILSYILLNVKLGYILPGNPSIPQQIVECRGLYLDALEAADMSVLDDGELNLSEMEPMLRAMLANQLVSVVDSADTAR